jgi:excisionase family DNA binding protein
LIRPETISRKVRQRFYYSVEQAGKLVGLSRTQAYRAAELGTLPTERAGKLLLVPKQAWDTRVKRLLRGPKSSRSN